MMKTSLIILLAVACGGCAQVRDLLYNPTTEVESVMIHGAITNLVTGEVVPAQFTTRTNITEWSLKPHWRNGVEIAGQVVPVPWAGPASLLILGFLNLGQAAVNRRWKKAAVLGVQSVENFKAVLEKTDSGKEAAREISKGMVKAQDERGLSGLFGKLVKQYLR